MDKIEKIRKIHEGNLKKVIGDFLPCAVVSYDIEEIFSIYYADDIFLNYLGYTYEELQIVLNGSIQSIIHPDDREQIEKQRREQKEKQKNGILSYRICRKDGVYIWIQEVVKSVKLEDGTQVYLSLCWDISEKMQQKEFWEIQKYEFDRLINTLPCGICRVSLDENLTFLYANDFYFRAYSYTRKQAEQEKFDCMKVIIPPEEFKEIKKKIAENIKQENTRFELEHKSKYKDGEIHWFLIRCHYDRAAPTYLTCVVMDITDRKQMEERLRISEEKNRIAIEHTGKSIDIYDIKTKILYQQKETAEIFGVPVILENIPYSFIEKGKVAEESIEDYICFYENMFRGIPKGEIFAHIYNAKQELRWYAAQYTLIFDKEYNPEKAVISYEDVTEKREKEIAFQKWSQYFEKEQEKSIGYYEYNVNKNKFEGVKGNMVKEFPDSIEKTFSSIVHYVAQHYIYEKDRESYLNFFHKEKLLIQYYSGKRELRLEHRRLEKSGRIFWALATIQLIQDPFTGDIKAFVLIQDIDTEKKEALQLQKLSETDALTGLWNRRAFMEHVNQLLQFQKEEHFAIVIADIDYFKKVNDSLGHQFGDRVLKEIASAICSMLGEGEFCGRLGGDEFIFLLLEADKEEVIKKRMKEICETMKKSYKEGMKLSGSLGLAYYPNDGIQFQQLYQKADIALYTAKENGRGQYAIYQSGMKKRNCKNTKNRVK